MHTVNIRLEESRLDVVLNILKNLKDGVIKSYSISKETENEYDPFFNQRKEKLQNINKAISSNTIKLYGFNNSIDELLREIE